MKIRNVVDLNYALGKAEIFNDFQIGIRENFILNNKEYRITPYLEKGNLKITLELYLPNFNTFELMFSIKFVDTKEVVLYCTEIFHIYSDVFELLNKYICSYEETNIEVYNIGG